MKYVQAGERWIGAVPEGETFRLACCDCGLVHDVNLLRGRRRGFIVMAAMRNAHATAAMRRRRLKE